MSTLDTDFFTNEDGITLLDRFNQLIKDTATFDCLVGYFYASGFLSLSESLKNTSHIRILIGLSTDKNTYDLIQEARSNDNTNTIKVQSQREIKDAYARNLKDEMEYSDDTIDVEKGVRLFIEWIRSGKLEIKVYREQNIHAKVYIMKFKKEDKDYGRVITGSSNFSKSGLQGNLEFNVELKRASDYQYAQDKFNELWKDAVDVSEEYVKIIQKETWLSNEITPYELYLKFLYEYLKEQINLDKDSRDIYLPDGYMELQYQKDAVTDAIAKLEEYGGVFISDVVGLGKTYITSMLLKSVGARALILAPPILVDRKNPGSWPRVLEDFGVGGCYCESFGKLDSIQSNIDPERYNYVVIDEAHKFRNENTQMYDNLYKLCVGKKVILVTATPLNNRPEDILAQIKLFQPAHASTLPNPETRDLEAYFAALRKNLVGLDRQKNKKEYLDAVRRNADKIRTDILQYLMVRRTRSSIVKYYAEDMKKQNLRFPEVYDPYSLYYEFDESTDSLFNSSIEQIAKKIRYARYAPLLYLKEKDIQLDVGQRNMRNFMKILLLKRLESSFQAFRLSVGRMITSYQAVIDIYNKGFVYTGDDSVKNLMSLIDEDNFEKIDELIDEGRVQKHLSDEFEPSFIKDLEHDVAILRNLKERWDKVESDPKLNKFIKAMRGDQNMRDKKVLIFTEAKETADYLTENLTKAFGDVVLSINGSSDKRVRQQVIDNFDGKVHEENRADDFRILVATEVLSEGVNLHRSNVVVNYDIPWNPVRMIQRVGRINRVDTKFEWIYIYNFFPTGPINDKIKLKELAIAKIEAFIEMLGNDAKLLTDDEIKSHDLFNKLTNKKTITGEDEAENPELKYLALLRSIRDNDPDLFKRVQNLPKKARVARRSEDDVGLITFFRRSKVRKIYACNEYGPRELDFITAASLLESKPDELWYALPQKMFEYLEKNKKAFERVFESESVESGVNKGFESQLNRYVHSIIQHLDGFTDMEIDYINMVSTALNVGTIPKVTIKKTVEKIIDNKSITETPYRDTYNSIRANIDYSMLLRAKVALSDSDAAKEVILSEFIGDVLNE